LSAQLTPQQKVDDFRALAALYAKQYGFYEWKKEGLNYDLLDIKAWLERVQKSATDLDYYEVLVEYVAAMQDSHARYLPPTKFVAQLGFTVDIYDGKILVDSINRTLLPMAGHPFGTGDELVSVDGIAAGTALDGMLKFNSAAHAVPRRRSTANWLTIRPQNAWPKAVLLGDEAKVVIRGGRRHG